MRRLFAIIPSSRRWKLALLLGALAGALAATGFGAYAAASGGDTITACAMKVTGLLRLSSNGKCLPSEQALQWNQTGPPGAPGQTGPPGPPGPPGQTGPPGAPSHAYRVNRGTPVEVTGIGTGVNGFPRDDSETTAVVSFTLPQGVFFVQSSVNVRKESGAGIFSCGYEDSQLSTGLTRTALGGDAGHARWASLSAPGFLNIRPGGDTVTLVCWQSSNLAIPGTPSGENPIVIQGNMNAIPVTQATITNFATGGVTEIP